MNVTAAYLHRLSEAERFTVPVHDAVIADARQRADDLIRNVVAGVFPANPESKKCRACDVRAVCKDAKCGKYDF